jgi:hypothetical protein
MKYEILSVQSTHPILLTDYSVLPSSFNVGNKSTMGVGVASGGLARLLVVSTCPAISYDTK